MAVAVGDAVKAADNLTVVILNTPVNVDCSRLAIVSTATGEERRGEGKEMRERRREMIRGGRGGRGGRRVQ